MNPPKPPTPKVLSRGLFATLTAAMLAVGVAAGAAIGPGPRTSLASPAQARLLASTLIPLALRANATHPSQSSSGESSPLASPTPPTATPTPTPTPTAAHRKRASTTATPATPAPKAPSKPKARAPAALTTPPPITHVWLVVLSKDSFASALQRPGQDPYLARKLVPKGALLSNYGLLAHSELANDLALLSGQSPNAETERNCPTYSALAPGTVDSKSGLADGIGCVYPAGVQTLADQLATAGLTWRGYIEGMGGAAGGASCPHPALGAADPTRAPGQPYRGYRNPFVYFDSLLAGGACSVNDLDLAQLTGDLAAPAGAPALSWIVPVAEDLAGADAFLSQTLPAILSSASYREHGLVIVTFDSGPSSASTSKPVGALLLSPFVRPGARVSGAYDQFSLLKSLERIFGVPPLGHAAEAAVKQFGGDVYRATKKAA